MAEFSKEYQELKGIPYYDFSLRKEFRKLKDGYTRWIICEGFGVKAMYREKDKCILLLYNNEEIELEELLKKPIQ